MAPTAIVSAPPPPPPPPPRRDYSGSGRLILYIGAAGAIGLLGWGIYSFLNNISGSGNTQTLNGCEDQWKQAFAAYSKQYQAYVQANGGAALTQEQENSLGGYVIIMNQAEQCMVTAGNASTQTWANAITDIAYAVVAGLAATAAFSAYLRYRGGRITSGAEARAAMRNSVAATEANAGRIASTDATGLVNDTKAVVGAEAETEAAVTGDAANAVVAAAEASGDEGLLAQASAFISDVVDRIVTFVTVDVYVFFTTLF